jgi:tRNA A-37 threonylcarbamoyl transferase component Bud32
LENCSHPLIFCVGNGTHFIQDLQYIIDYNITDPGSKIVIRGGLYEWNKNSDRYVKIENINGTFKNPIEIIAYENEEVIIQNGALLDGFFFFQESHWWKIWNGDGNLTFILNNANFFNVLEISTILLGPLTIQGEGTLFDICHDYKIVVDGVRFFSHNNNMEWGDVYTDPGMDFSNNLQNRIEIMDCVFQGVKNINIEVNNDLYIHNNYFISNRVIFNYKALSDLSMFIFENNIVKMYNNPFMVIEDNFPFENTNEYNIVSQNNLFTFNSSYLINLKKRASGLYIHKLFVVNNLFKGNTLFYIDTTIPQEKTCKNCTMRNNYYEGLIGETDLLVIENTQVENIDISNVYLGKYIEDSSPLFDFDGNLHSKLYFSAGPFICDILKNCGGPYFATDNCTSCLYNYDVGSDCIECIDYWNIEDNCQTCISKFDEESSCQTCLQSHFSVDSNCESCKMGYKGTNCTTFRVGIIVGPITLTFFFFGFFIIFIVLIIIYFNRKKIKKFLRFTKIFQLMDSVMEDELSYTTRKKKKGEATLTINKELFIIKYKSLEVIKRIGSGGSESIIYLVKWNSVKAAFKCFNTKDFMNQEDFNDFEKEVSILSSLSHPFILKFYGATMHAPRCGIVCEYCVNGDLLHYYSNNIVTPKTTLRILGEIAKGMMYLHSKNIIHRDVKSQNCLLDDSLRVKIMDFGLSKFEKNETKTVRVGTSHYMAPEVIRGGDYSLTCDVFSYAIIIYELTHNNFHPYGKKKRNIEYKVAGEETFRPPIEKEKINRFPKKLKEIMIKCWSGNPKKRNHFIEIVQMFYDMYSFFK